MRSTYDILSDLKPRWDEMSSAEKVALGTTLAGVNQYKVFSAVMNNFDQAVKATNSALDSSGATARQNAVYMESLQAKINMLKQEFQKLVLEGGGLNKVIRLILDIGIAVLKIINSDWGKLTVLITVVVSFTKYLKSLHIQLSKTVTLLQLLGKAFSALSTNPFFIGGVIAGAIVGVKSLIDALGLTETKAHKCAEAFKDASEKFKNASQKLEEDTSKLENINKELKNLQDRIKNLSGTDLEGSNYMRGLKLQEKSLERQVRYLETMIKLENQVKEQEAKKLLSQEVKTGSEVKSIYYGEVQGYREEEVDRYETLPEQLQRYTNEVANLQGQIDTLLEKGDKLTDDELEQLATLEEQLVKAEKMGSLTYSAMYNAYESIDGVNSRTGELDQAEVDLKNSLEGTMDAWENVIDIQNENADINGQLSEELEQVKEQYRITDEQIQKYIEDTMESTGEIVSQEEAIYALAEQAETATHSIESIRKSLEGLDNIDLKDIKTAFQNVAKAQQEMNSASGLSLNTFEDLMSLDVDYIAVLFDEEGNLRNNADAMEQLYYAKVDQLAITKALDLVENAVNIEANGQRYIDYAKNIDVATNSMWGLVYATIAEADVSASAKVALSNQAKSLEKMATQAKKNYKTYTTSTKATGGHTSATKKDTEALKENVEALKKQKEALSEEFDQYKKVVDYINSKIDDEIDKLEEEKDAQVDLIDAQIDGLKDLKDVRDDYYDKEINRLEELRDAEKEYWNDRIQALKDANDELEDQLELEQLLQALETAKSKKVKVYKEGQGFVYDVDQSAVALAQKNLDEYNRKKQFENELKQLEDQRDAKVKIYDDQIQDLKDNQKKEKDLYDSQIKALEAQKKAIEDRYNDLIKFYQDWKNKFGDQVDAYDKEQNRLLALQLTGIDFENQNWKDRLSNLDDFVAKYVKKQKELATATEAYNKAQKEYESAQASASSSASGGGVSAIDIPLSTSVVQDPYVVYKRLYSGTSATQASQVAGTYQSTHPNAKVKVKKIGNNYVAMEYVSEHTKANEASSKAQSLTQQAKGTATYAYQQMKFATGASSIPEDQMGIVGDAPNREIVIGSKLNNGVMAKLPKGTGIVNAKSTNTLAGILNQLGFVGSNFGMGSGKLNNHEESQNFIIENVTINGANITDINSFRNSLMNLKAEATQRAYRRK